MGLRFRKSIKLGNSVKLNIGKKSVSMSVGGKGARYTVISSGRRTERRLQALQSVWRINNTTIKKAPTERPVRACTTPTNHSKWTVG